MGMSIDIAPKKSFLDRVKGFAKGEKLAGVMDGFRNAVTGVGTKRSKSSYGGYAPDDLLTFPELESLFESNDLASVIVGKIVEDALRARCSFECEDSNPENDREEIRKLFEEWDKLGAWEKLSDAATFARLKGNAGLILVCKGAGRIDTPMDDEKVTEVVKLIPWDAEDMQAHSWYPSGEVETYMWTPAPQSGPTPAPMVVHETRLLMFPGAKTTSRGRQRNRGWDHSVLQRVYAALKSFDGMFGSTDSMFADASQAVFTLQGFLQSLAEADGAGSKDVETRLQLMDLMRSAQRAIFLDAGDETGVGREDFKVVERPTLAQLDGVMQVYLIRLAAAARMPLTVLLGMSPAGMDATGESDMILYYNTVDTYRKDALTPRIMRLAKLLSKQAGVDMTSWEICWPELSRPTPLDVANGEKMRVDSVIGLVASDILLPEEAALNLRKIAPTMNLTIQADAREKAMKAAAAELESREHYEEPEPAAVPGASGGPSAKASKRKTPAKTAGRQT
jgi:phage-related protein (TIGR01555 family)